ncbi:potassium-transporting ATPase subunit C [Jatrophihabitans fulvus]
MRRLASTLRQAGAALRLLLVFTVVLGVVYPLAIWAVAQLPGLSSRADGSMLERDGRPVGSGLIGQSFTDAKGNPLKQYLQSRPSAGGYDPLATGASNLGPESIVDAPDKPSLLTQVCQRSVAVGTLEKVSGARPYCADGVGAVLAVVYTEPGYRGAIERVVSVNQPCPATPFVGSYRGVTVQCAKAGEDVSAAKVVPVRGDAPAHPAVPADAVTASGSGIDPEISLAYARLQEPRIAATRGITRAQVAAVIDSIATGRDLGFIGTSKVNVLKVNLELDRKYPYRG